MNGTALSVAQKWHLIRGDNLMNLTVNLITMNKETAEKMLEDWEIKFRKDFSKLCDEKVNRRPCFNAQCSKHSGWNDEIVEMVQELLEAQKVVERERSVNVYDACIKAFLNGLLPQASAVELKERFHKELLESFRQEILQSTKE